MSNAVPCFSGICGVSTHIPGSQAQIDCSNKVAARKSGYLASGAAYTTTETPIHEIAARAYLNDTFEQQQAINRRTKESVGLSTGNPLKALWGRIRYNQRQRAEMAESKYNKTMLEPRVAQSFKNLLQTSQDARPTPRTGEPVKPMENFRGTDGGSRFENIKYVHWAGGHPSVTAIQTTRGGLQREVRIRYERDGITVKALDDRGNTALEEYHDSFTASASTSNESEGRSADWKHEQNQALTDLLIHVQNEKNWING